MNPQSLPARLCIRRWRAGDMATAIIIWLMFQKWRKSPGRIVTQIVRYEMSRLPSRSIFSIVISGIFILTFITVSHSEVVVFDDVTTVKTPTWIKVLTKGRIFAKGGRLVDIYLDQNHLKRILTGGDGFGYLKYTPQKAGFVSIEARSDASSSSGLHLVMKKNDRGIIIDIEGSFKDALFSEEIREHSQEAVKSLSNEYKIIYISRYVGKGVSRGWLERENFPSSVILRWQGSNTLKILKKKGINLYAVIGSAAVISAAKEYIDHRYTFEKSKDGKFVGDWDEILELLQTADPAVTPEMDPAID